MARHFSKTNKISTAADHQVGGCFIVRQIDNRQIIVIMEGKRETAHVMKYRIEKSGLSRRMIAMVKILFVCHGSIGTQTGFA